MIDRRRKPTLHGAGQAELAGVGPAVRDRGERRGVVPARIGSADEAAHRCSLALSSRRMLGTVGSWCARRNERPASRARVGAVVRCLPAACRMLLVTVDATQDRSRQYRAGIIAAVSGKPSF